MKLRVGILSGLFITLAMAVSAASFKIAVVDLNRALNESESGIRSRNILETKGLQKQQEIRQEEEDLRADFEKLTNNLLLSPDAKAKEEASLRDREQQLRALVQQFEQELRLEERQLTEEIFRELKASIRSVSIKKGYDIVLEKTAAEVILYMNMETTDLTQDVIDHYNGLKSPSSTSKKKKK